MPGATGVTERRPLRAYPRSVDQRTWTLSVTVPGEPTLLRRVSHNELVATLRARMAGELPLPDEAELRVCEARVERVEREFAHAA